MVPAGEPPSQPRLSPLSGAAGGRVLGHVCPLSPALVTALHCPLGSEPVPTEFTLLGRLVSVPTCSPWGLTVWARPAPFSLASESLQQFSSYPVSFWGLPLSAWMVSVACSHGPLTDTPLF